MGTNNTTANTDLAPLSGHAYADLLRDEAPAANRRRDLNLATNTPHCDFCGRRVNLDTAWTAWATPSGALVANGVDPDEHNADEILMGSDCAQDVPAEFRFRANADVYPHLANDISAVAMIEVPATAAAPDLRQLLSIARDLNEANLREIVDGAIVAAREAAEEDLTLNPTGAIITDTVGRIWLEMRVQSPDAGTGWTAGWYSNDGHVAVETVDVFDEDAWVL